MSVVLSAGACNGKHQAERGGANRISPSQFGLLHRRILHAAAGIRLTVPKTVFVRVTSFPTDRHAGPGLLLVTVIPKLYDRSRCRVADQREQILGEHLEARRAPRRRVTLLTSRVFGHQSISPPRRLPIELHLHQHVCNPRLLIDDQLTCWIRKHLGCRRIRHFTHARLEAIGLDCQDRPTF